MIKNTSFALRATFGAALLAISGLAAASSVVTVDSMANSFEGGAALDSGVALNVGELFTVSVPTTELWNNSFGDSFYDANANGNTVQAGLTVGGFTSAIGSLVGEVGNGDLFTVGTSYTGHSDAVGDLKFFYWDTDAYNNVGAVQATISAVPEPTSIALLGLGLAVVGLSRRRKI